MDSAGNPQMPSIMASRQGCDKRIQAGPGAALLAEEATHMEFTCASQLMPLETSAKSL